MADQRDVQKLIQGLVPGAVNNGNPNTIWNTPGTVQQPVSGQPFVAFAGTNPLMSALPPMTNAAGGWFTNPLSPAATLGPLTIPSASGNLGPILGQEQLGGPWQPSAPALTPNLATWNQPNFFGTGLPPGTPGTGPAAPGTGGNQPPLPTDPNKPVEDPTAYWGGGVEGGGLDAEGRWQPTEYGITIFGDRSPFNQSFSIHDPAFQSVWGVQGLPDSTKQAIGTNPDGTVDQNKLSQWVQARMPQPGSTMSSILQGLDSVSEMFPLLQGIDWYNAETGKLNLTALNAVKLVANALGLGPVLALISKGIDMVRKLRGEPDAQMTEGCVTVDSVLEEYDRADQVQVGDLMAVIDPKTFEYSAGKVTHSESKMQPCVRIETKKGVVLECSESAPIADENGDEVLAPNLLGVSVPVVIDGVPSFDVVMSVKKIGEKMIRHITVENNFFLAGQEKGKYLLHHNAKSMMPSGGVDPLRRWDEWAGQAPMGWGGNSFGGGGGVVTVGNLTPVP